MTGSSISVAATLAFFSFGCNELLGTEMGEPIEGTPVAKVPDDGAPGSRSILLAEGETVAFSSATVAWDPDDREYGIVFAEGAPRKLRFARVDALGRIVLPATPVVDIPQLQSVPSQDAGASMTSIAAVGPDRWVIAYVMTGSGTSDQGHVFLVDDEGHILHDSIAIDNGLDTESVNVAYSSATGQILVTADRLSAEGVWSPHLFRFDADLSPLGAPVDTSAGQALLGCMVPLPELEGAGGSAMVSFTYMDLEGERTDHLAVQRVDLATGTLGWPSGSSTPGAAGQVIMPDVGLFTQSRMAWIPEAQRLAFAYTEKNAPRDDPSSSSDAHFGMIEPSSGAPMASFTRLNAENPQSVAYFGAPEVAWDGEELLVLWVERSTSESGLRVRMTRFDSAGRRLGEGERLLREDAESISINGYGRAIAAHDGIHAVIYTELFSSSTLARVALCIDPPCD